MLATRPGRTHRWSFREDADGLTLRLNLPARIGGLERACEADTTGAKGGPWSPKAGLGKVSEVWAFKRPYTGRGGARARVGSSSPDGYRACTIGVGGQAGRVVYRSGGESKQRRRLHGPSIHPPPPPGAGAPLDLSGERERLAATVDPASEGRWVRKSVRG